MLGVQYSKNVESVFKLFNYYRGVFYTIWLCTDPLFIKVVRKRLTKLNEACNFSKTSPQKKSKYDFEKETSHPMNAFLCSSLNMELVCAILQGIQNHIQTAVVKGLIEKKNK